MDTEHLLKLGREPISDDAPCGENARYEEEYESLLAEVGKLESLHGGTVDWARVVELGSVLLESKTKDLLVAAYVAGGMWETEGPGALVAGLALCRDLTQHFWEGAFPKRLRARRTAINWLMGRVQGWVAEESIEIDPGTLEDGIAVLRDFQTLTEDRWEGDEPELFQAERALAKRLDQLHGEAAEELPETPAGTQEQAAGATATTGSAASDTTASAGAKPAMAPQAARSSSVPGSIATRADALSCLVAVAGYFEHTEPHSPISMLIRRAVRWGGMDYRELYAELLRHDPAGRAQLWELLGLETQADGTPPVCSVPQAAPQPSAPAQPAATSAPATPVQAPPRVVAPPPVRPTG